jgi:hypothetical protein
MMIPRRGGSALVALALALLLGGAACTRPAASADTASADLAMASATIEGDWRIVTYRPDTPLEPSLAGLLALQVQTMTLRFDGQRMTGTSPTLRIARAYRVTDAAGPHFGVVLIDEMGVGYELRGEFEGPDQIAFRGANRPWAGTGTL